MILSTIAKFLKILTFGYVATVFSQNCVDCHLSQTPNIVND